VLRCHHHHHHYPSVYGDVAAVIVVIGAVVRGGSGCVLFVSPVLSLFMSFVFIFLFLSDASADVFFSPSTAEGFPLVFLESIASGTPVVGANEGGTPLTFENKKHGIHFPPHDQNAAVDAIMAVLTAGDKMKNE
jgi:glycosyltransferase involved in cell wall biosynthesis